MPCGSPVIARPVGPSGDCACGSHPDPLATTGVTVVDIANDPHRPSCLLGKKSSGYNGFCVRRAKLGVASRGQVPASEALARHRVLSVASLPVTSTSKRTQGVRGPQCESVKGLSAPGNVGNSGGPVDSSTDGSRWHNWQTGRKPNGPWEVGCPHTSEDVG